MDEDRELLRAYVRDGSEEAFATLARRYLDLVYSSAMRQLNDADQARDVAQAVFLLLARKAASLGPETVLAGWLYRTARFVSLEALRAEKRRRLREEKMASALHDEISSEELWAQVSPHLDEAMAEIPEADRNSIVLRYFEDLPVREVGAKLGLSEEAAKKRVHRALEKLRAVLAHKGIKSSSSLLGTALVASAVQPTPAAMAAVIVPALAVPGAAAALPVKILVKGTLEMMTYAKVQASTAALAVLLMIGGTGYVGVQHVQALQEQSRGEAELNQMFDKPGERTAAHSQLLAQAQAENQRLREQARELYRLRDTLTQLRAQLRAPSASANALNLRDAPREFQESAERLMELQYEHFMAAGMKAITLQPLTGLTEREKAEYTYEINLLKNVGLALRIYATDHGDEFPATIETLLATDILNEKFKEQLQSGKYEYIRFTRAESKPGLPAVWWRSPDTHGIRLVALNDGSVQRIREPEGVPDPGSFALAGKKE
jgi:RNA polymerase sigma factor (sigma-70 family)